MANIELSGIFIYPVKSMAGISLKQAQVEERGFQYDRRWMIVDENGKHQTQRVHPRMTLVSVQVVSDGLQIDAPNFPTLHVPFQSETKDFLDVTVWANSTKGLVVNKEANAWFSEYLGINCKLVYMPDSVRLEIDAAYNVNNGITSFSDGFPYLIIGQSSLDDLNTRLDTPVPMKRFRPNIVVTGTDAYTEDTWRELKIGSLQFYVVKPCARCVMTTIDTKTAEKGNEPLRTLSQYRNENGNVLFGMNMIPAQTGVITVGDPVSANSLS